MKNSTFKEIKNSLLAYYQDCYDYDGGGISSNNRVLQEALEHFNELLRYHNITESGQILNSFKDSYGDQTLKQSSIDKLIKWLVDQDMSFLFEDDLIIEKGADWYVSKQACLYYKQEEPQEDLEYWLQGEKLTEKQKDTLESLLCSCIDDKQEYLYIHPISFEFIIPRKAILREYKEYIKATKE